MRLEVAKDWEGHTIATLKHVQTILWMGWFIVLYHTTMAYTALIMGRVTWSDIVIDTLAFAMIALIQQSLNKKEIQLKRQTNE